MNFTTGEQTIPKNFRIYFLTIMIFSALALFTSIPVSAEPRLLYPQEQALKAITNKLEPIIKDFKIYNSLHAKGEYLRNPTPELTEMLAQVNALEKEFAAQNFPPEIKKIKNIKTWFTSLKKNTPILEEVYLRTMLNCSKSSKRVT